MSNPNYFSYFKNIKYALSADKAANINYIDIKDYFHTMRLRDDIFAQDTMYTEYVVKNGERPEQIAYEEYGDEKFYYIILQVNNIVDYYNDWPMSEVEFDEYITKKYVTPEKANEIHHYETVETFDSAGNLVLKGGLVVSSDYIHYYRDGAVTLSSLPIPVTNVTYERRINEDKAQIQLLDKKYIYDYEREIKKYAKSLNEQISEVDISEVL